MDVEIGKTNLEPGNGIQNNETLRVIYSRRAIRKYKDIPVEKKWIEKIIDAGRMAPSAMNAQPWKFYVLSNVELIRQFSRQIARATVKGVAKMGVKQVAKTIASAILHPENLLFFKGNDFVFHGAPVVIFITSRKDNVWAGLDIGACAQNMMLAAKSIGLDSCPVGIGKFVMDTEIYSKLNVKDNEEVKLAVILGYGDEVGEVHERKLNNLFYIN
jgi:nitroreductase